MKYHFFLLFILLVAVANFALAQEIKTSSDTTQNLLLPKIEPATPKSNTSTFPSGESPLLKNSVTQKQQFPFEFKTQDPQSSLFKKVKPYLVPAALLSLSLYSVSNEADYDNPFNKYNFKKHLRQKLPPNFGTSLDDYLQYAPLVITKGLQFAGVQGENDWINSSLLSCKANLLVGAIVTSLKYTTNVERPDGSSFTSFPSGHTATAFCNATIMHMEYGKISPWYSVAAYSMATATGAMRMMNNKHWLPDVLAGAAIGIATTRLVYATHQYRWGKKPSNLVMAPTYSNKTFGLCMAYTF